MDLLICKDYRSISPPVILFAVSLFSLTFSLFFLLLFIEGDWNKWSPALCLNDPQGCFCEKPRLNSLIRQPANTFSNLAFSFVGVVVLVECIQQRIEFVRLGAVRTDIDDLGVAFTCTYALSQIILGAGSAWFHASLTFSGQWIDNAAMYLVVSAPILYALAYYRLTLGYKYVAIRYIVEWIFLNSFLGILVYLVPETRRRVFTIIIVTAIATELYVRQVVPERSNVLKLNVLGAAVASLLIGFALWILDIKHILCSPESLWQGHAAWHLLTGIASFLLYCYYAPVVQGGLVSPKTKKAK